MSRPPQLLNISRASLELAAPAGPAARIALHACPIPHQCEVAAFAAHLAFIAARLGFGAAFGGECLGFCLRIDLGFRLLPGEVFQRLRRRELGFRLALERGRRGRRNRRYVSARACVR